MPANGDQLLDASILELCGASVQHILDSIDAPDPEIYLGLERLLGREMISVQFESPKPGVRWYANGGAICTLPGSAMSACIEECTP